jgi:hypothetical protein
LARSGPSNGTTAKLQGLTKMKEWALIGVIFCSLMVLYIVAMVKAYA